MTVILVRTRGMKPLHYSHCRKRYYQQHISMVFCVKELLLNMTQYNYPNQQLLIHH